MDAPCGRPGTRDDKAATSEPKQIEPGHRTAAKNNTSVLGKYCDTCLSHHWKGSSTDIRPSKNGTEFDIETEIEGSYQP